MGRIGDSGSGARAGAADADAPAGEAPIPDGVEGWGEAPLGPWLPDEAVYDPDGGFWVFGYGSLMWDPGFPFVERRPAMLPGFKRSFCLWSIHYRGTKSRPGLVLALDRELGVATRGVAYRVAPDDAAQARRYIAERELVSAAYEEVKASALLLCETTAAPQEERAALTYVVDRAHEQYSGPLTLAEQAAVIEASIGPKGRNCEYLFNTVAHLRELGLTEEEIGDLVELERGVKARRAG